MVNTRFPSFVALLSLLSLAGAQDTAAPAAPAVPAVSIGVQTDAKLGAFLTGLDGKTLYMYAKDADGVSNCVNTCPTNWPPLLAAELPSLPAGLAGKFSLVNRPEGGAQQVAYNGKPLYYWRRDAKAGDTLGQGLANGDWAVASFAPTLTVAKNEKLGDLLVGPNGLTVYAYAKDYEGLTACTDTTCQTNWPPVLVGYAPLAGPGVTGKLGVTTRADGSKQVTYNNKPLYYWRRDAKPGDTLGQGLSNGDWSVVKP